MADIAMLDVKSKHFRNETLQAQKKVGNSVAKLKNGDSIQGKFPLKIQAAVNGITVGRWHVCPQCMMKIQ